MNAAERSDLMRALGFELAPVVGHWRREWRHRGGLRISALEVDLARDLPSYVAFKLRAYHLQGREIM